MVRTTLGAEVETSVTVQGSEAVDFLEADQSTDVVDTGSDSSIIRAPANRIYELVALKIIIRDPGGTTDGFHRLRVQSESEGIELLRAESDGTTNIIYRSGGYQAANLVSQPTGAGNGSLVVRGARVDETNGLEILYDNRSGATQTRTRLIRVWVREIQVGES
jgi:hypothetical protein